MKTLLIIVIALYLLSIGIAINNAITAETQGERYANINGAMGWFCALIFAVLTLNTLP